MFPCLSSFKVQKALEKHKTKIRFHTETDFCFVSLMVEISGIEPLTS